ncbi:NAD(P)-binding protein [Streptomyces sp. NPDC093089]|uniref:NAD(P)-binding protein n=1 Tax=Streptomyces sp. NPDC093089 TaxID=3366024 RepID=UPI00381CF17F
MARHLQRRLRQWRDRARRLIERCGSATHAPESIADEEYRHGRVREGRFGRRRLGAGAAGLACAADLAAGGVAARLLEADESPGGRMRSDQVAGFTVDRDSRSSTRRTHRSRDCLACGDCGFVGSARPFSCRPWAGPGDSPIPRGASAAVMICRPTGLLRRGTCSGRCVRCAPVGDDGGA